MLMRAAGLVDQPSVDRPRLPAAISGAAGHSRLVPSHGRVAVALLRLDYTEQEAAIAVVVLPQLDRTERSAARISTTYCSSRSAILKRGVQPQREVII